MEVNIPTLEEKPREENHELQLDRLSWGLGKNEKKDFTKDALRFTHLPLQKRALSYFNTHVHSTIPSLVWELPTCSFVIISLLNRRPRDFLQGDS